MTTSPTGSEVDDECVAAVRATASLCESLGHHVEEATLAVDGDAFTAHFVNQWACANAWAIEDWETRMGRVAEEGDLEPLSWALVELGRSVNGGQYLKSVQELQRISRQIADYFEGIDVLLTPTLGEPPAPLGTFDSPPGRAADRPLPCRGLCPLHPSVQRDGPTRDLVATALERRRPADRRAVRRAFRGRGDAALALRPARAGGPVGGTPAAGRGVRRAKSRRRPVVPNQERLGGPTGDGPQRLWLLRHADDALRPLSKHYETSLHGLTPDDAHNASPEPETE